MKNTLTAVPNLESYSALVFWLSGNLHILLSNTNIQRKVQQIIDL